MFEHNPFSVTGKSAEAVKTELYRQTLANAVKAARSYDGTEASHDKLFNQLFELEQVIGHENVKNSDFKTFEIRLLERNRVKTDLTIDKILDLADKSLRRHLTQNPDEDAVSDDVESRVLTIDLPSEILPPQSGVVVKEGDRHKFEPRKQVPRLNYLLELLNHNNVFLDDIVIYRGANTKRTIRQSDYVLIEIPRLGKSILLSDDIGEATFVVHKKVVPAEFLGLHKDELMTKHPDTSYITFRGKEIWSKQMHEAIFGNHDPAEINLGRKVDVRSREVVRDYIRATYTPSEFMSLSHEARREFSFGGKKMSAIAHLFGCSEAVLSSYHELYELAAAIWSEDNPEIKGKLEESRKQKDLQKKMGENVEAWRSAIKEQFPDGEKLFNLSKNRLKDVNIAGRGVIGLARIFGITESPLDNKAALLEFVKRVYGKNEAFERHESKLKSLQERRSELSLGKEYWIGLIKTKFSSGEAFFKEANKIKDSFRISGASLHSLGTVFGVPGYMTTSYAVGLLTRAIFGDNDPWVKNVFSGIAKNHEFEKEMGRDTAAWSEMVRSQYPDAAKFLNMTPREWRQVRIGNKGLTAVASILGVSNVLHSKENLILFLKAVYGENDESLRNALSEYSNKLRLEQEFRKDPNKLREKIISRYPNPDDLLKMSKRERAKIKIEGFGNHSLPRFFGLEGDLREGDTLKKFLQVVYGDENQG